MTWLDVVDAMNPANVPRPVPYREWRWMPFEPITHRQRTYLAELLRTTGTDPATVYGEGFVAVEALSQWAASWGIQNLQDVASVQDAREQRVKRLMGAWLRERMEELPVRRCATCDEDRPHRVVSAVLICESCKEVTE